MAHDHDHEHEHSSGADSPFIFRGEVLALDFINTVINVRGKRRDLLDSPSDLALWWDEVQRQHPYRDRVEGVAPGFDDSLLDSARMLRAALRRIFLSLIDGEPRDSADQQMLNAVLRTGTPALDWSSAERPVWVYHHDEPDAGVLLPVALSALHLLTEGELTRLHRCHNDRCIVLFYDTSKSGTRQWCSTGCFERERSSRRYAERKASGG